MINRICKTPALNYSLSSSTWSSNCDHFRLLFQNRRHFSKMDSVNVAARGWSTAGTSSIYEKTRPDYNPESVEFLLGKVGALKPLVATEPFTIVELGAGTGKFTRAALNVLEKHDVPDFKYIATEPLKEMCEKFKEMVPNVEILQCPASDLSGLSSSCADIILAAQCFHWFGMDPKALDELDRVLKPKGTLGIIWNLPDRSVSWIKTIEEWLDPKFENVKIPRPANQIMFVPLRNHGSFINEGIDETRYNYEMRLDFDGILERYKANSVVSAASAREKETILKAIEQEMKTNVDIKGMTNNSVDAVLAAMSFHWFYSHQKAIEEIHRVIKTKGMLGLIWYVPDRSVSWIKHIEGMLDQYYAAVNQVHTYDKKVFVPLRDHGGFINEGCDLTSYTYSQEFNVSGIIDRYSTKSIIASAEGAQKDLFLGAIEEEIKTNPETKNKNSLTLKYAMKIHWFQKA